MVFHHSLSIFGLANTAFQCKWGTELVGVVGLTEVSNPVLQIRWFLKSSGYLKSVLGELVDLTFLIVFTVFRLIIGGYVSFLYITYPNDDILGKIGCSCIYAVSLAFYYYILGYSYNKYHKMYNSLRSGSQSSSVANGMVSERSVNGHPMSNGHIKSD